MFFGGILARLRMLLTSALTNRLDLNFRLECAQNLSYDSHHPVSHKRSVAKTLLQRAESLPSNSDSQANEREYVLNILGENDYPKRFLNDSMLFVKN